MHINPWVNPPPMNTTAVGVYSANQVWELGSVQELRWSASIGIPSLNVWQDEPGNLGVFVTSPGDLTPYVQAYNWTVSIGGLNLAKSPAFFLELYDSANNKSRWFSHYINITVPVVSSSAAAASSTTQAASTPSSPASTPSTSATPTQPADSNSILAIILTGVPSSAITDPAAQCFLHNTPFGSQYTTPAWYTALPAPAQSYLVSLIVHNTVACTAAPSSSLTTSPSASAVASGLSTGAKAGIGIGAAIGGIAAVAGLMVLLWWWRRRGGGAERAPVELGAEKGLVEGDAGTVYRYQAPPQEILGDERVAHEMGVEGVRGGREVG